jgi:hypothetical protein
MISNPRLVRVGSDFVLPADSVLITIYEGEYRRRRARVDRRGPYQVQLDAAPEFTSGGLEVPAAIEEARKQALFVYAPQIPVKIEGETVWAQEWGVLTL